ncbi:MAG: exo-alpha-sialidase, partial [Alphaproteobacteria bacterium]|nr:exo-alpha-sialidase [Alphaproteobacteria bacterium]
MTNAIPLWDKARPFPPPNTTIVPGIRYSLVHRQTPDFEFLHEPRLAHDGKTLYVNFSNAPKLESEPAQVMRGRRSTDGGKTWSGIEVVAGGFADGKRRTENAPQQRREDWG